MERKTRMDIELTTIKTNGSDTSAYLQVAADKGNDMDNRTTGVTERDVLLSKQNIGSNGEMLLSADAAEGQRILGNAHTPIETSFSGRMKKEMNAVVFSRVRLWMIILFILVLIIAVIIISLLICSVIHEDEDDKFDPSSFRVPRYFGGSFQLPKWVFTEELLNISSSESRPLAADLVGKLENIFRPSPALGRYFSRAEIKNFRNGSVIADYQLTFLMPEDDQDQLSNFTLSNEMVYNVFRQFLYDQDPDESELLYIDPVSLSMP